MRALILGLALIAAGPAFAAEPPKVDWSKVPAKVVKLFYPGQASYQWTRSADHKKADKKVQAGTACLECHEGEEADIGDKIAAGKRHETLKLDGKAGTVDLSVQAAYDAKNVYWRFQWKTKNPYPGDTYTQYRFDGKEWKPYGKMRLTKEVQEGTQPPIYEDRLTIMLDDGKVPMFAEQGCWLTCHNGMRDMPEEAKKEQIEAVPLLAKRADIRKYLPSTRTDALATWNKAKTAEEVAKLKADGQFVDLMQWRAARSNDVGMADDGYVLEYRNFDEGKNMFGSNLGDNKQPKFMFDAAKVGVKALTADKLRDPKMPHVLVKGQNAVPFDANAGWKEGDLLPAVVVGRADATGSAADNATAIGEWKGGQWTVVWARPLDTGHPQDDKVLKAGGVYTVGLAVHDDNMTGRGHFVSFPQKLGLGVKADIQAVELK